MVVWSGGWWSLQAPCRLCGPRRGRGRDGSVVPAAPSAPACLALGPGGPDGAPADQARPWSPPGLRTRGFRLGDQTFVRFGVVSRAAWLLSRASLTCGPLQLLQSLRAPAAAEGEGRHPVASLVPTGPALWAGPAGLGSCGPGLRTWSRPRSPDQGCPGFVLSPSSALRPQAGTPGSRFYRDRVRRLRPSGPAPPQLRPDWVVPGLAPPRGPALAQPGSVATDPRVAPILGPHPPGSAPADRAQHLLLRLFAPLLQI